MTRRLAAAVAATAHLLGHLCALSARPGHLGPLVEVACLTLRQAAGTVTAAGVVRDLAALDHVH